MIFYKWCSTNTLWDYVERVKTKKGIVCPLGCITSFLLSSRFVLKVFVALNFVLLIGNVTVFSGG